MLKRCKIIPQQIFPPMKDLLDILWRLLLPFVPIYVYIAAMFFNWQGTTVSPKGLAIIMIIFIFLSAFSRGFR
jgi:hypothetical protein